jgi:hypothetical protein
LELIKAVRIERDNLTIEHSVCSSERCRHFSGKISEGCESAAVAGDETAISVL